MFCQKYIFLRDLSLLISKMTSVFLYHVGFPDNQHYHIRHDWICKRLH